VVLEGPEVERLIALAEVDGQQVAAGAPADEAAVGTGPGIVTPERGLSGDERGVLADA
jgi:hypothetical protein